MKTIMIGRDGRTWDNVHFTWQWVTDGLDLATLGLRVFPVKQGTKEPAIVDYQERATCDPEAILAWGDSHGDGNLGMMIDPGYFV